MINNPINVSKFNGVPPASDDASRKINGGPLYQREEWLALAEARKLQFWSNGAIKDGPKWNLSTSDVADLIVLALRYGRFKGSEWCQQKPNGPWAACDAYTVTRIEQHPNSHKDTPTTYYLKAAISKTGTLLLSASNHPEGT